MPAVAVPVQLEPHPPPALCVLPQPLLPFTDLLTPRPLNLPLAEQPSSKMAIPMTGRAAGEAPVVTAAVSYAAANACVTASIQYDIKGHSVPLSPCLAEDCTCRGIFYKDVLTTSSRIAVVYTLRFTPRTDEAAIEQFKRTAPALSVKYVGADHVVQVQSAREMHAVAEFVHRQGTNVMQWVWYMRPTIATSRHQAVCNVTVGDGANAMVLPFEVRSKPSQWLLVENLPSTWTDGTITSFIGEFASRGFTSHTCRAVPNCVFVALATRPQAPTTIEAWVRVKNRLADRAPHVHVSWILNVSRVVEENSAFMPGSGWKAPDSSRANPVFLVNPESSTGRRGRVADSEDDDDNKSDSSTSLATESPTFDSSEDEQEYVVASRPAQRLRKLSYACASEEVMLPVPLNWNAPPVRGVMTWPEMSCAPVATATAMVPAAAPLTRTLSNVSAWSLSLEAEDDDDMDLAFNSGAVNWGEVDAVFQEYF